jgi:hypothetical protein
MANQEHLAILRQGVEAWNAWRKEHLDIRPDLGEAELGGADLSRANLKRARLSLANLTGANLTGANLSGVRLGGTNLAQANLAAANLLGAFLIEANLTGANLTGVTVGRTFFADCNLSATIGLATIEHDYPSYIGVDTLYRSKGKIPESFLRGCGMPDALIEYLPSLLGAMQPIQFYSCFISYSTKDEAFARRLHQQMQAEHLRVWFAPEDLKGGQKLHEQIEHAIQMHDRLLVILSPHSRQSKWVMDELRKARRTELADNRRKLFPIRLMEAEGLRDWECLDPATGQDIAAEVREYHIPDFTTWKDHDAFERAFARLLRDLKAVDAPPAQPLPPVQMAPPTASAQPTPAHLDDPVAIIALKRRRLRILEEQQAKKGDNTPPEVIIEIEDLRREIAALARSTPDPPAGAGD